MTKQKPIHHASDFDLDVTAGDSDMFRWFLLSYLFGKPIQATVAVTTWKLFIQKGIDTPWAILDLSHRQLVILLNEGSYARYSETTARGLRTCMQQLVDWYEGSLVLLFESSENDDECAKRLQKLYGVGPKIVEIFMSETEELFARRIE